MPRVCVATIVHISDLHIGELDQFGNAVLSPKLVSAINKFPLFDGLIGHSGQALADLVDFVANLNPSFVIATGDMSRYGATVELLIARHFLESEIDLQPPLGNWMGLRLHKRSISIPGNHDHWGGMPFPLSGRSSLHSTYYGATPYIKEIFSNPQLRLTLMGIDSDADVDRLSIRRLLAIGAFESQLKRLEGMLQPRLNHERRVLLIHHSRSWQGRTLGIADRSKQALDDFLHNHEISLMMCGHTHEFGEHHQLAQRRVISEFGAGTTTQLDELASNQIQLFKHKLNLAPNTLIVHRVFINNGSIEWESEPHMRSPKGFIPLRKSNPITI